MIHKVYIDGDMQQTYGPLSSGTVFRFIEGNDDHVYMKGYLHGNGIAVNLSNGLIYQPRSEAQVRVTQKGSKVAISVGMGA